MRCDKPDSLLQMQRGLFFERADASGPLKSTREALCGFYAQDFH